MNSNECCDPNPPRGRIAWVASAVVLVLAGGAWLLSRPADASRPVVVAPASRAPATPRPMPAAASTESASLPGPTASTAAAPPVAPPVRSMPATAPADALRKVQQALEGRATPNQMLEAARMLEGCQGAAMTTQIMYGMRDRGDPMWKLAEKSSVAFGDEQLRWQQAFQRLCQVFDADTLARRGELLKGAYEGGAKDSALPYLQWINGTQQPVSAELRRKLQNEARQTVESGDFMALSMYSLAFNPVPLGITEVQRQAYKEAMFRIDGEMAGPEAEAINRASMANVEKNMSQWGALPPPLSPEQQQEADALTQKVVDAWRKRQGKGHGG